MSRGGFIKACALLAACLAVGTAVAQRSSSGRSAQAALELSARPVGHFSFHGTGVVDALLALGREEQIPLAIESVDMAFVSRPVSIDVKGATVGSLLGVILAGSKGYRWSVRDGVIHVTNTLEPPARGSLLERRIPDFKIGRVPLTEADRELGTALIYAAFPRTTGIVGDYPGYNERHPVGPLTLRNTPVWVILDALIKFPPGGAWVAMVPPPYLSQWNGELWKVVGYNPANFQYLSDTLRYSLPDYPVPRPGTKRNAATQPQ